MNAIRDPQQAKLIEMFQFLVIAWIYAFLGSPDYGVSELHHFFSIASRFVKK
ncbi:MAG TPA: hypothetical protein V6C65_05405 [Allocoleopsis sp.]